MSVIDQSYIQKQITEAEKKISADSLSDKKKYLLYYKINTLSNDVSAVESNFIDQRKILMNIRMESNIRKKLIDKNIEPSLKSPLKILVSNEK